MDDAEDFMRVEGKVPRRDKDGNDITNQSLGSGGARRDDGTLSALAYDLEPLSEGDESPTQQPSPGPSVPPWLVELILRDVVIPAAKAGYPHLKAWVSESAAPAAKARWQALTRRRRTATQRIDARPKSAELEGLA